MDLARFLTLASVGDAEHRVRGSLFLGHAAPVSSEEEARAVVAERQTAHFAATHNCFAWRLHDGSQRASDAGECEYDRRRAHGGAAAPGCVRHAAAVRYPYQHTAAVMRALEHHETFEVEHGYADCGQFGELSLAVPAGAVGELTEFLREATAGEVRPDPVAELLTYVAAGS